MRKVFLPRSFFLGLSAYVNQAELSLDRMRPESQAELSTFYQSSVRYSVESVISRLRDIVGPLCSPVMIDWRSLENELTTLRHEIPVRIGSVCSWYFRNGVALPVDQLGLVVNVLEQFSDLLKRPDSFDQTALNNIRLRLRLVAVRLEQSIPNRQMAGEVRAVLHLNYAKHLKLKGVEEIAGEGWLHNGPVRAC